MNSQDCFFAFHAHDAQNCKYAEHVWRDSKNNMDVSTVGRFASFNYESINTGIEASNNMFSIQNWTSSNTIYSLACHGSSNLFGSSSIKKGNNIVLNTVYSQHEYEQLCAKIISHMQETGEW